MNIECSITTSNDTWVYEKKTVRQKSMWSSLFFPTFQFWFIMNLFRSSELPITNDLWTIYGICTTKNFSYDGIYDYRTTTVFTDLSPADFSYSRNKNCFSRLRSSNKIQGRNAIRKRAHKKCSRSIKNTSRRLNKYGWLMQYAFYLQYI